MHDAVALDVKTPAARLPFMFPYAMKLPMTDGASRRQVFTPRNRLVHTAHKLFDPLQTSGLARFRALKNETPKSKIALSRSLYPEIVATLRIGHTLREIQERLAEDGVDISYALLRNYISRMRREHGHPRRPVRAGALPGLTPAQAPPEDPLANAMRALSKPRNDIRQAMCDGDPTRKKLV